MLVLLACGAPAVIVLPQPAHEPMRPKPDGDAGADGDPDAFGVLRPRVDVEPNDEVGAPTISMVGLPAISTDGEQVIVEVGSSGGERARRDRAVRWLRVAAPAKPEDVWIVTPGEDQAFWEQPPNAEQKSALLSEARRRADQVNARLTMVAWRALESAELRRDDATRAVAATTSWGTLEFRETQLTLHGTHGELLFQKSMTSWTQFVRSHSWVRPGVTACAPVPVPRAVWFDTERRIVLLRIEAGGFLPDGCGGEAMIDLVVVPSN